MVSRVKLMSSRITVWCISMGASWTKHAPQELARDLQLRAAVRGTSRVRKYSTADGRGGGRPSIESTTTLALRLRPGPAFNMARKQAFSSLYCMCVPVALREVELCVGTEGGGGRGG